MAKIHRTPDPEMYILIMEKDEAKALGKMIEGASLEKRRWFVPSFTSFAKWS